MKVLKMNTKNPFSIFSENFLLRLVIAGAVLVAVLFFAGCATQLPESGSVGVQNALETYEEVGTCFQARFSGVHPE